MRDFYVTLVGVLAVLLLSPTQLLAYDALSEDELDRTIASGIEPATTARDASVTGDHEAEKDTPAADNEESTSEVEFALVAYRAALPIVMNRMTGANYGPLGPSGNYSLIPLFGPRSRLPVSPVSLKLGPFPSRLLLFGR